MKLHAFTALAAALFAAGCATTLTPPVVSSATSVSTNATPPSASAAPAAAATAARPAGTSPASPGAAPVSASPSAGNAANAGTPPLRPFADVIKDAKKIDGLFTLYEKEDKVYLELSPEQLGQLFFLQANVARGLPEDMALAAFRMLRSHVITFKRQHNTLQVIARNFRHQGEAGTPLARAVDAITSDSLLVSVPVLSQPHAERKSFLVEANSIFFADLMNLSAQIENGFRSGYTFDGRNSNFSKLRSSAQGTSLALNAHFATPRLPTPPPVPTPGPQPTPVRSTPDARSFFIGLHYSLARLPEVPMRTRVADDRVGHFNIQQWHYSNDALPFARQYVVRRWRLEKGEGAGPLVEPKKPITFWIDRNVPNDYREAVREGVLEWNKAFEKIGFKNALVVKQQENNDEDDTDDTMRASIRWFVDYSDGALAVGPSTIDPRTGEILDADISIGAGWARLPRRYASDHYYRPTGSKPNALVSHHQHDELCTHGEGMMEEASFALDLLDMRGDVPMDGPQALAISKDVVKSVVAHEVGHTLGFRHNFRSSTIYTQAQLADPEFTKVNGLTGSIMDYVPFNIALKSEPQGAYYGTTIGPYDYWAVEYAYKEFSPAEEKEGLAAIANRSAEPYLAYATDDEISGDGDGMDPDVNQRDLGNDPIAFAKRRLQLTRELWETAQSQTLPVGTSYSVQRRRVDTGMTLMEQAMSFIAKNIGGVTYLRDHAGTGRANYTPIPAQRQRDAMQFIADTAFRDDVFTFPAEFMNRLPLDNLDRTGDIGRPGEPPTSVSFGEPERE
jgi:hypothetical protein